jgi:hypothetical protein
MLRRPFCCLRLSGQWSGWISCGAWQRVSWFQWLGPELARIQSAKISPTERIFQKHSSMASEPMASEPRMTRKLVAVAEQIRIDSRGQQRDSQRIPMVKML